MFKKYDTEVLVVGSGPVGLFAALRLVRAGVPVRIIDQRRRSGGHSYALALHERSYDLLLQSGLRSDLLRDARLIESVAFYRRGEKMRQIELPVRIVSQQTLEDLLLWQLGREGVEVHWGHRLRELQEQRDGFRAVLDRLDFDEADNARIDDRRNWNARYVFGADGRLSAVRQALNIDFPVVGPSESFVVFEFQSPAKLSQARIGLDGPHVNVLWPLGEGRFRWSFQVEPDEKIGPRKKKMRDRVHEESTIDLDLHFGLEQLENLHAAHRGMFEASIEMLHWSASATFQQRWATASRRGRAVLLGDAAHVASPVGVHSMNAGLREAARVVEALCSLLKDSADEAVLTEEIAKHRTEWRRRAGIDRVSALSHAEEWIAPYASRIPAWLPASGEQSDRLLFELGVG